MSLDVIWEEKGCWLLIRMEEKNKLLLSEIEIFFNAVYPSFQGQKSEGSFDYDSRRETWGKTLWAAAAATVAGTTWGHRFFSFHHHQHHVGKITWFRKVVEKGRVAFSRAESYLIYAHSARLYTFFSSYTKNHFYSITTIPHKQLFLVFFGSRLVMSPVYWRMFALGLMFVVELSNAKRK